MASPKASVLPEIAPPAPFAPIAALRAGFIAAVILAMTLMALPVQMVLVRLHTRAAHRFAQAYHRAAAWLMGIRITVIGAPIRNEGVLLLANHTSWMDITVFGAVAPLAFVAKAEVDGWPLFGTLARLQRTVFVAREKRGETGKVANTIRERLQAGEELLLFPEGTSHDGNEVLPFKSALLGAAETRRKDGRHVPVQPVSAAYVGCHGLPMGREMRPFYAWYGEMEMLPHLWEALKAGPVDVVVRFHPPLSLDQIDRKEMARMARNTVARAIAADLAGRGP